ncbi:hypothetical protein V7S43_013629 [Phytophthora oleae]|uniref:Ricin B lectin domain-containing protein n=1 Tax=Phytophthora oleae TaxID=2107226 RepID=A0ABD3F4X9_9STRA
MSLLSYGSDPDVVKVEVDDGSAPVPSRPSTTKWRKLALATAGTTLCIGSAVAMYQGWSYLEASRIRAERVSRPSGMFLESQFASEVKSDVNLLYSGEEIMLRVRGKGNLCVDDGGGWTAASSKFTNKPCNPSSPNQIFKYNSGTKEFESVYKTGLCIDDGGAWWAAGSTAHLWYCDANNQNQWFDMDPNTLMLKNPVKDNLCFDDGNGGTADSAKYVMWYCDDNNGNQHFEVLSRAAMAAEKKATVGTTPYDLMVSGKEIMFRVKGKDMCVDDGGSWYAATTKFVDMPCNPDSPNQAFKYNIQTGEFESVSKPGLCMDDGGSWWAAGTTAHLWYCDIYNQNQWFDMDETTMMMKNPVKDNLCFDDGGGQTAGASRFVMWYCDNNNPNQHFEVVLRETLAVEKQKTGPTPYDMLLSGEEIMFRVKGKKNLCVDDGGGWGAAVTKFIDMPCNPSSPNQVFKYDVRTLEFQNVNKPGLCMDDGGSWDPAGSTAHLWWCDTWNQNQWYVLDESTMMLRNPVKDYLCVDDGGGKSAASSNFLMQKCDLNSPNEHFEIVSRAAMAEEKKNNGGDSVYDSLLAGREVLLRVKGKNNLCMDDGGGWNAASTRFVNRPCNPDSMNQVYKYNVQTREFENVNKPGLCINDGGSWQAGGSTAFLYWCDQWNQDEWFIWDEESMTLHNPMKDFCFDDGGGQTAGSSQYVQAVCSDDSPNQKFEIVLRSDLAEEKKKKRLAAGGDDEYSLLVSGQKIMIRMAGKDNLCMDDGGGRWSGSQFSNQKCDPDSRSQVFTYDEKLRQFKSANKPEFCIDDGGGWWPGQTIVQLWTCDSNNQNQWFTVDEDTMMIHTSKSTLCLDDGGGWNPGQSQYHSYNCDDNHVNQKFEILSQAKMAEEKKQRLIDAGLEDDVDLLSSGKPILLRLHDKKNLCLDDGGGRWSGGSYFRTRTCNPSSQSQVFTYKADTQQFASFNRPDICIDDGGGWWPGSYFWTWNCDPNNQNQFFVWDPDTMLIRSSNKNNLCLDDGGGMKPGQTWNWLWTCDSNSPNQRFEIVSQETLAAEKTKERIASGNTALDILATGQEVMLSVRGKNSVCLDDGGGGWNSWGGWGWGGWWGWWWSNFADQPCNPDSPNQIYTYDAMTHQLKSANKPGMCIDDGGAWWPGWQIYLWFCDPDSQNQKFVLDGTTLMLQNPYKDDMCLDDGQDTDYGWGRFMMNYCDEESPNQHFEVLPRAQMLAEKRKRLVAAGVDDDIDLLNSGRPLMLKIHGKDNLCTDDGGGHSNAETKFVTMPCDPTSPNQIFTYEPTTHLFRSVNKPALCIDDGGGWYAGQTTAHLYDCDQWNMNQWFILDEDNMMLRNPAKPNLCFDDGGGLTPGDTQFMLWNCDLNSDNQHFEIVSPDSMAVPDMSDRPTGLIVEPPDPVYMETIESGVKVLIRSKMKGFCLDDGGGHSNAETKFVYQPCDPNSPNQIFSYDVDAREFQSVNKLGLCLDDGGGWDAGTTTAHLWDCDSGNMNQWFVTDATTSLIRNPAKPELCLDDGGSSEPGSQFRLWYCNSADINQQFEVVPQSQLLGTEPDVVPPPLPDIVDGPWTTIDNGDADEPPRPIDQVLASTDNASIIVTPPDINAIDQPSVDQPVAVEPTDTNTGWAGGSVAIDQSTGTNSNYEEAPAYGVFGPANGVDTGNSESKYKEETNPDDLDASVLQTGPDAGPLILPDQVNDIVPPPNVTVVKTADMPLVTYGDGDWNLLAPSNETISVVNTDNSASISAAEIFQYLQSVKNKADFEHEVAMYRYKRTFACVSDGLQQLAKDAVTEDEYHVLVQWMYDHCAAGPVDVDPIVNPSPPIPADMIDDVIPGKNATFVTRQFMTKLEFYYEIKNHYAGKDEQLVGDAAVANLRAKEHGNLEKKLVDCIEQASERYGYNKDGQNDDSVDHLKEAIAWVDSSCMKS